ncbi:MAG: division/cell wall cluster transcriptional repressor MraZ [Lachnospiraceae bacterium]|nr:division/cell wall cluster transcriptional repressor MraZ [Lachnospiraceae bacterium]
MFMGEYRHNIDEKGRLIVPAKFREALGKEFVVTKGIDQCLFVYPLSEWKIIEEKFREANTTTANARKFARFFFAGACNVEIDKQGRILLPNQLREFADLTKDIVTVGVLNRVEIWSGSKWDENNTFDDMDEIAEQMAELGIGI